ncbi:MAG: peptidoglycan editing factor PgeF [Pseudomonadales bacterium]|jgi:YfiH family protein|nr:peptidoglycan editing factor PgeF [Pseudomonadales bacterium]
MQNITKNNLPLLTFEKFNNFENELANFVSTRHGGVSTGKYESLNLAWYVGDDADNVVKNKEALCDAMEINFHDLHIPRQVHETKIVFLDEKFKDLSWPEQASYLEGIDAIITNQPHLSIAVATADCVSIILYCPQKKIIAAVHAGWRGTAKRILSKTLDQMIDSFGCNPKEIIAGIAPCISAQAYNVGEEVIAAFRESDHDIESLFSEKEDGKMHLDLKKANLVQLLSQGLSEDNIEISNICTYGDENFFSARRLGNKSGRFLTGLMMR